MNDITDAEPQTIDAFKEGIFCGWAKRLSSGRFQVNITVDAEEAAKDLLRAHGATTFIPRKGAV